MASRAAVLRPLRMIAVSVTLAACSQSPTAPWSLSGEWWTGPTPGGIANMSLVQSGSAITGRAWVTGFAVVDTGTVTGNYSRPNLTLEIVGPGNTSGTQFTGHMVNETTMVLDGVGTNGTIEYEKK
jgi:hypothetical protein